MHQPAEVRAGRDGWIAAGAVAAAIGAAMFARDLGQPGVALPIFVGMVLAVGLRLGALSALAAALVTAAGLVWLHAPEARVVEVIAGVALLLGLCLVARAFDGQRQRIGHLERVIGVLRHDTRRPPADTQPEPEVERMPAPPSPPERAPALARTGSLPRLLYRYARLLNVTDEDALYTGLALTLEEVLPAHPVAVYRLEDDGLRRVAGDSLDPPPPEALDVGGGQVLLAGDGRRAFGRIRVGADGPLAAVIIAVQPGGDGNRPGALKLLATFVDWASAGVGHARALRRLDVWGQAETARLADARGRAAARAFARTGAIPVLDGAEQTADETADDPPPIADGGRERAPRPSRMPVAGQVPRDTLRPDGAGGFPLGAALERTAEEDDTERIDPALVAETLGEARPRKRTSGSLPFAPPRLTLPSMPRRPASPVVPSPPAARERSTAPGAPPPRATEDDAEHLDPDVRIAIERMARRLAAAPASPPASEARQPVFASGGGSDFDQLAHDRIDDEMVSAEDLPLIGGPGLGVATEVGRSAVKGRFAHLLADLSDHLDADGEP